jgi:hypothetical protein
LSLFKRQEIECEGNENENNAMFLSLGKEANETNESN